MPCMAHEMQEPKNANEQTWREFAHQWVAEWTKGNAINIFIHGNYSVNRGSYLWLTKSSTSITIIIEQTANDGIYAKKWK